MAASGRITLALGLLLAATVLAEASRLDHLAHAHGDHGAHGAHEAHGAHGAHEADESPAWEDLFQTAELEPTFPALTKRECLPAEFDTGVLGDLPQRCGKKATGAAAEANCGAASTAARFYNCLGSAEHVVSQDGSTFNSSALTARIASFTSDTAWISKAQTVMSSCLASAQEDLAPRQKTVSAYLCWKWSMFADCDQQQAEKGELSDDALERRTKFLAGDCALSPAWILSFPKTATGLTRGACSSGAPAAAAAAAKYDAEVKRIACHMEKFKATDGSVDFAKLMAEVRGANASAEDSDSESKVAPTHPRSTQSRTPQIARPSHTPKAAETSKDAEASKASPAAAEADTPEEQFQKIVDEFKAAKTGAATTVEEFVRAWAGSGVASCVAEQANHHASHMPKTCAIVA